MHTFFVDEIYSVKPQSWFWCVSEIPQNRTNPFQVGEGMIRPDFFGVEKHMFFRCCFLFFYNYTLFHTNLPEFDLKSCFKSSGFGRLTFMVSLFWGSLFLPLKSFDDFHVRLFHNCCTMFRFPVVQKGMSCEASLGCVFMAKLGEL